MYQYVVGVLDCVWGE